MDPGGRGSFSADEEADNIPSIINTAFSEGDTVCIPSSGKQGCLSSTADRSKRKTMPAQFQYVSRTLNDAEKNYSPLEKLALSLVNMTRRLRRYFEAHPVKVITDQPIKNILSRTEASGKLAKYAVEIGTYKISFLPRNAIKGQVLADFLSDAPDGEAEEEYFRMPEVPPEVDDTEVWTLFHRDGAASLTAQEQLSDLWLE
ncbi:reverse transcriptase domain-containing protein [Tanacetum coccineum]|uniref:Reverse transcriptase domain-containing protein n=1 Tax=Tanacetum coccineum TaxID=301880 RepID=A0ABQ5FYB6_9ASTR